MALHLQSRNTPHYGHFTLMPRPSSVWDLCRWIAIAHNSWLDTAWMIRRRNTWLYCETFSNKKWLPISTLRLRLLHASKSNECTCSLIRGYCLVTTHAISPIIAYALYHTIVVLLYVQYISDHQHGRSFSFLVYIYLALYRSIHTLSAVCQALVWSIVSSDIGTDHSSLAA